MVKQVPLRRHTRDGYTDAEMAAAVRAVAPTGPVALKSYTVATVPAAAGNTGSLIYVSDGAGGSAIVAFSDGTSWLRVDTGAAVAAA